MSLIRLPKAEFLLIGGVRAEGQVAWSWIDGSDFRYTNWAAGPPKGKYQILELDWEGRWHDTKESHASHAGFICEWDH